VRPRQTRSVRPGEADRVRVLNPAPTNPRGRYVLYWMVATRRLGWSYALDRALAHARAMDRPLVILEPLRLDYGWASDRHHRFALDGMKEHRAVATRHGVGYHPYVEPLRGAGKGLLEAWADDAAVVVTDDFPAFFLPRMQAAAARKVRIRMEAVDSSGLLPLAATSGPFSAAVHFRRHLQRTLPAYLLDMPDPDPLAEGGFPIDPELPQGILARWPSAEGPLLEDGTPALAVLDIDHDVRPAPLSGGTTAARQRLSTFLSDGLDRYATDRNHPDADVASGLSPWLHWGHVSAHEVFHGVVTRAGWSPARLGSGANGRREGWWGLDQSSEAFLDQLVTWRELGYSFCRHVPEYGEYLSLPRWALETLEAHAGDPRPYRYTLADFEDARTHDELWNAAQRELRQSGTMHNYLRMLWGKKILEWTSHPREALDVMVHLNNRWALDGRDPNSWSGITWVLGRFDRGWPERSIYGKVRSMSSESTRRKVRLKEYLVRWRE
jgi:deoxyribodipyrimidine photo-lyase